MWMREMVGILLFMLGLVAIAKSIADDFNHSIFHRENRSGWWLLLAVALAATAKAVSE